MSLENKFVIIIIFYYFYNHKEFLVKLLYTQVFINQLKFYSC